MPLVPFGDYEYVPVLGTTEVERLAYNHLQRDTRAGIIPVFELTRRRGAEDLHASIELVRDTITDPFLLDLDKRYAPPPYQAQNPSNPVTEQQRVAREAKENEAYNAFLRSLLSPANGFENWRRICGEFENAVPVLQFTNPANQVNSIIRQASLLSQGGNSIAIRISRSSDQILIDVTIQLLAMFPSSGQLLIIFDCGQGRRGVQEKIDWISDCLARLLAGLEPNQITDLPIVCMSNSYPPMNHDGLREITNCDREIWLSVYEQFPFHFGDYAASSRAANLSSFLPRSFRATVVHSLNDQWLVHRHVNADDPQGWAVGAQEIVNSVNFDPINAWTDGAILKASRGDLSGMDNPRPWHAARIAGHIDRQFRYQPPSDDFDDLLD